MVKKAFYMIIYLLVGIAAADNNAPLHYQSKCVACHEQMVSGNAKVLYMRKDRLAKNYEELKQRVDYCIEQLKLNWDDEQIHSVVDYLAKQYYQYPLLEP